MCISQETYTSFDSITGVDGVKEAIAANWLALV